MIRRVFGLTFWRYAVAVVVVSVAGAEPGWGQVQRYVSVSGEGSGSGISQQDAARYLDPRFWSSVQSALATDDVVVTFRDGRYAARLSLQEIGSEAHTLTLRAETPHRAVFTGGGAMALRGSRNIIVREFGFTGQPADPARRIYKLQVGASDSALTGVPSQDILIQGNAFYDSLTYYGAVGVSMGSHHVTIHDNDFRNIGENSHAHMIYSAYSVHHIKVIGNRFEDSKGDYVRFRDRADFGEVRNNTFRSTGKVFNRPFIQMPVFNNSAPGKNQHASNYLIVDNEFIYETLEGEAHYRSAMGYLSWGYEPEGLNYLPSAADGIILERGTPEQRRRLLLETMDIDLNKVRIYRNTFSGEHQKFRYGARARYGAEAQGWEGDAEMIDAINSTYVGAGDVYSDGKLDEKDVAQFIRALKTPDEQAFLLDNRVWFGDYAAADINGDGVVDLDDVPAFLELFSDIVPNSELAPVRALLEPETDAGRGRG